MHDYQTPDRGWCGNPQRGAAMGRGSDLPNDTTSELTIRRVPLVDGGDYDPGGTYWGGGPGTLPLFCVSNASGAVSYVRARDFNDARAQFPRATWAVASFDESDIDDMVQGYSEAALWSTNDESDESGGEPFDANYSTSDLSEETRATFRADCLRFVQFNCWTIARILLATGALDWSQVGHDFWLTRNGHGVGFSDRNCYGLDAETLDDACGWRTEFGEVNLYLGDDGQIHQG